MRSLCAQELMESDVPFCLLRGVQEQGSRRCFHISTAHKKRCACWHQTGVAALNVNGEAIHSFSIYSWNFACSARRMAAKADKDLYKN